MKSQARICWKRRLQPGHLPHSLITPSHQLVSAASGNLDQPGADGGEVPVRREVKEGREGAPVEEKGSSPKDTGWRGRRGRAELSLLSPPVIISAL